MAQSQNSTVDLATPATCLMGLTSHGNVMVGNKAFEYYNERNPEDYIQIPWDEVDYIAAEVLRGTKKITRFAIFTKDNGHFTFSTRDDKETLRAVRKYVDEVVTVSEDEIAAAILALMEKQKLVAEGAGAVTVAAAMFGKLPIAGKKVCCLISGGNIDVNILNRVITRGLVMSGRKANLTIALEDKPGQLERVAAIVSRCGSNVVSVLHDGSDPNMPISSCFLKLVLETRDHAQIEQIRQELTKEGFQLVAERV